MTLTTVDEQTISFPWIELVKNAYAMRVRVTNFSAVGKRSFTRILSKAVGGVNSYFLMQDGDPLSTDYLPSADLQLEKVAAVGLDGRCYDENAEEIDENLRCLTLSHAPVTDQAVLLAQRAMVIEGLISQNLEHLMLPEPVVVGTSPDVVIKTDPNKNPASWTKFDANDDHDTIVGRKSNDSANGITDSSKPSCKTRRSASKWKPDSHRRTRKYSTRWVRQPSRSYPTGKASSAESTSSNRI